MLDYYRVGLILRPHGVRGALKLQPLSDELDRFHKLREAYLEKDGYQPVEVSDVSVQPDAVFLRLSGVETREDAERLRNIYLCVDRAHTAKLPEGRYFVADLIGCAVRDTNGRELGRLAEVLETGANDVYVIEGERRLMIPALKRLLSLVDVEKKQVVLDAETLEEVGLFED